MHRNAKQYNDNAWKNTELQPPKPSFSTDLLAIIKPGCYFTNTATYLGYATLYKKNPWVTFSII